MNRKLSDPRLHPDWLRPHSIEWYGQLGRLAGQFAYPWNSTLEEPNGETLFAAVIEQVVRDKNVLDIGCGHGAFTMSWGPLVKQITGLDVTCDFIHSGNPPCPANVRFVTANTKAGLPFERGEFDVAYNRRGPTSAYLDVKRVVKEDGMILGLHPGDKLSVELSEWFPGLFEPLPPGTPVLENLLQRLEEGGLGHAELRNVSSIEYLHEPLDVIRMRFFGQTPLLLERVTSLCLSEVTQIFEREATNKGLPITFDRYYVKGTV